MKRKATLFSLFMLFGFMLKAQMTLYDSLKARYDSLQPYVQTGLLADRNPQAPLIINAHSNPLKLNGINDTTISASMWRSLHMYLYHMAYDTTALNFHPSTYELHFDMAMYGQSRAGLSMNQLLALYPKTDIVLGLIDREFNMITSEAWDSAYIRIDTLSNRYFLNAGTIHINDTVFLDTVNYSTHPDSIIVVDTTYYVDPNIIASRSFSTHRSIVLGALHSQAFATGSNPTVQFYIPSSFLMELPGVGATYEIDFDDGLGFRPWPSDSISISYTSYGEKNIVIRTPNNGPHADTYPYLISTTKISVTELVHGPPDDRISLPSPLIDSCTIDYSDYGSGEGIGFVKYRYNAGPNPGLHKPVIILEGFESAMTKSSIHDHGNAFGFGALNWYTLSTGDFGGAAPQLKQFPDMMDSLRSSGYDIILLDFYTNRTTIQQNGNLFINLVRYVNNQLKANGSHEEIVVIGPSMGGLISRWGLRKMELEGCCHNTRLFCSMSAPHQGANIPLGLQEFLHDLGYDFNLDGMTDPAKKLYDEALNSPVSHQMLVYHRNPAAAAIRAAFVHELDSMGFPKSCRLVGMTNGSAEGRGQQQNNEELTGNFLMGGDMLVSLKEKLHAPLALHDFFAPALGLIDYITGQNTTTNHPWTIGYAEAYAINNSNGTPSTQLILERGDNLDDNLNRWYQHLTVYGVGLGALVLNDLVHEIAKVPFVGFGCLPCPVITGLRWASYFTISATFAAILVTKWLHNEAVNYNYTNHYRYVNNYPTLSYDNAPGDYTNSQQDIFDASDGVVRVSFGHHTFIPTVSALAIDTTDLFINIQDHKDLLIQTGKIPFEFVYFNEVGKAKISVNQAHLQITDDNISYIMKILRMTDNPIQGPQNGQPLVLSNYYNYGEPKQADAPARILKSTRIVNQGLLHVNHYGKVGYLTSPYDSTQAGSSFQVETFNAPCGGAHVEIENGGQMILGGTGQNFNRAEAIFHSNSILEIYDGGKLTIHDLSRLLIEDGAQLVIHPGAIIELLGNSAVLEIAGKIVLKDNANFTFTGDGMIRLDQQVTNANKAQYWDIGLNSSMTLEGAGKQDVVLEVVQSALIPQALDSIVLKKGKVLIRKDQRFNIFSGVVFDSVDVTASDTAHLHSGVRLHGQQKARIDHSDFSYGKYGIQALLLNQQYPITITNSTFSNNTTGLHTRGKQVTLENSSVTHNSSIGWWAQDMDGYSATIGSQFEHNFMQGISFNGQQGSTIYLNDVNADHNYKGVETNGADVEAVCSHFDNNGHIGLYVHDGDIFIGGQSGNSFQNNTYGIYIDNVANLAIADGVNNFVGSTTYIAGDFSVQATSYLHYNSTTQQYLLDVKDNNMPSTGSGFVPVDVYLSGNQLNLQNWSPYNPIGNLMTSCDMTSSAVNLPQLFFSNSTDITVVVGNPGDGGGTERRMNDAIVLATDQMSNNATGEIVNDLKALDIFDEIFTQVHANENWPSLSADESLMLQLAYYYAQIALSNAYKYEALSLNRAGTNDPDPYVSALINEANRRLSHLDSGEDYDAYFELELSIAHLYRLGEYYTQALEQLSEMSRLFSGNESSIIDYWDCVCKAEKDLLLEHITAEQFLSQSNYCYRLAPSHKRQLLPPGRGVYVKNKTKGDHSLSILIHPNPSARKASAMFDKVGKGASIRVITSAGDVLFEKPLVGGSTEFMLSAPSSGVYVVQLLSGSNTAKAKWVVQ